MRSSVTFMGRYVYIYNMYICSLTTRNWDHRSIMFLSCWTPLSWLRLDWNRLELGLTMLLCRRKKHTGLLKGQINKYGYAWYYKMYIFKTMDDEPPFPLDHNGFTFVPFMLHNGFTLWPATSSSTHRETCSGKVPCHRCLHRLVPQQQGFDRTRPYFPGYG